MEKPEVQLVGGEKLRSAVGQALKEKVDARATEALGQLQQAAMQAAFNAAESGTVPTFGEALTIANANENKSHLNGDRPRGNGGTPVPAGRPKGVRNKLTNLRDAVLEAFDTVGGAQYLVKLANGTQSDRAAFTGLVAKVLPTQINQQVEGGIRLELSWLGARSIGTTQAQIEPPKTQVLDLETDSDGRYRIKDPTASPAGGQEPGAGASDAVQDAQQGAQGAQGASE